MILIPGTVETARFYKNLISVYKDGRVRFGKNTCKLLDLPKNKVAFEYNEKTNRFYVMVAEDGYVVSNDLMIANRPLCKKICELLQATKKINMEVEKLPGFPNAYLCKITDKE